MFMFDFVRSMNLLSGGKCLKRSCMSCGPLWDFYVRKSNDFWKFWTCPFSNDVHFLKFDNFSNKSSPGQNAMVMMSAAQFCVEPRTLLSNICHHGPKTLGKPLTIVSWPECRPQISSDGGDGSDVPTTLP